MAGSRKQLADSLRVAAHNMRKQASELRNKKPVIKLAGFTVDMKALKELIAKEG